MKTHRSRNPLIFTLALLTLFILSSALFAQEENPVDTEIDIPFIDRDGDGINDFLQTDWGMRFVERYQKRRQLWEQLDIDIVFDDEGNRLVDTDGDGVGDIAFRDYMKEMMGTLIDTDGDGIADTALRDYLGRRFQSFDHNGDGMPDDVTKEEMQAYLQEMRQWREEVRDRVNQGLPPFVDDDGDGIPDNLPGGYGRRQNK